MSNAAIYIRWGRGTVGRETKGLEVFSQALEYYASLEKQKKIAAHRTYIATNGSMHQLAGFILLEGEVAQLREVVDSDEFRSLLLRATQVVEELEVVHMNTGDEVQKSVMQLVNARRQLGITT
jgi:hypothetical protein